LNNVDLNKLLTFLIIAELGGVTAAAKHLSLTRSAISHSLCTLEGELGIRLFHRVGKALVLTGEGRKLRRAVGETRERLGAALDEIRGLDQEVQGAVRIGLFLGFSRFRLARAVDEFTRRYPKAVVRFAFGPQSWLLDQLLAGKLDLTLSLRPSGSHASAIRSEKLTARPLVLVVRGRPTRVPRDFARISELSVVDYYQSDPLIDRWTGHHFGRKVPRERIRAWAASTDLALELVLCGSGAAVVPEDVAAPFQRQKLVSMIAGPEKPLLDHVWLNELSGARANRAPGAFRELLHERG
jgi:DNA-binding transcriptional LysR family regulator